MVDDERSEELRKLKEELEALKDQFRKMSEGRVAPAEPEAEEPVEVPMEGPEEAEEPPEVFEPEEVEVLTPEERPPRREPLEEEEREERRHRERDYDFRFDWGDRLGDYISGFVEDVMEGVADEIESALFIHPLGPRGPRMVVRGKRPRRKPIVDEKRTASIMSALGNEYRLKILDELSSGGMYASDLQEALKDISPSTLSSHLDVLEEAGLILQERRRGRYLITIPGRLAIKMAYQIARRISKAPPDL